MWGARGLEGWGENWSPLAVPVVRTHTCCRAHVPQPGNELLWILLRKGPGFVKCLRAWSSVSPKNIQSRNLAREEGYITRFAGKNGHSTLAAPKPVLKSVRVCPRGHWWHTSAALLQGLWVVGGGGGDRMERASQPPFS